jgi:gliding motility-associated-like protein
MKKNQLTSKVMHVFMFLIAWMQGSGQTLQRGYDAVTTHKDSLSTTLAGARIIRIGDPIGASIPTVATPVSLANITTGVVQPPNWYKLKNVFGVTIDNIGNVYFANSSSYEGYATFSTPFGSLAGATQNPLPAVAIYKANATNLNMVTNLCTYSTSSTASTIGSNQFITNGFGFGNICNSPSSNFLYASNLLDGKIYEINSTSGNITNIFDPFTAGNSSSGIASYGERIYGLGINKEVDGSLRLYYALQVASNQNEIWSVKLNNTGGFVNTDNTFELKVRQLANLWTVITDITFSNKGYMAFAERSNNPHNSASFECYGKHLAWSLPKENKIANFSTGKNSNGGVTYGSVLKQNNIICDSIMWVTANAITKSSNSSGPYLYGGHSIPSNISSTAINDVDNAFVYDNDNSTFTNVKGAFGDIEFFDSCTASKALDPCNDLSIIAQGDTSCCLSIEALNTFNGQYITGINVSSPTLTFSSVTNGTWGNITQASPNNLSITAGTAALNPNLPSGGSYLGQICTQGGNGKVYFYWIGNAPQYDTVCVDTVNVQCITPSKSSCIEKVKDSIVCENGNIIWYVQFKNVTPVGNNDTIRGVTLNNTNPDIDAISPITNGGQPIFIIPALGSGQTSAMIPIPLSISNNATNGCFTFQGCDPTSIVNNQVQSSLFCCNDTNKHCFQVPSCGGIGGCRDAFETIVEQDQTGNCCAKLTLINSYLGANLDYIELNAINGVAIVSTSGWSTIPPASSTFRRIQAPGLGLPAGTYNDFMDICIGGTSAAPHQITVSYFTKDSINMCSDTIEFEQCNLVTPKCGVIIEDSLYCLNNKTYYTFKVKNNGSFPIGQIDLNMDKRTLFTATPNIFQPTPFIPVGGSAGPYTAELDTINGGDQDLCLYLSAHDKPYTATSKPDTCCSDIQSKICYPFLNCKQNGCCEFEEMKIPNGITPNGDKINDVLFILKPASCDSIKLTVFNRWGNQVWEDKNYINNWGGTNQSGSLLPQGTYFMIIELKNGSKKGLYVDVRY